MLLLFMIKIVMIIMMTMMTMVMHVFVLFFSYCAVDDDENLVVLLVYDEDNAPPCLALLPYFDAAPYDDENADDLAHIFLACSFLQMKRFVQISRNDLCFGCR